MVSVTSYYRCILLNVFKTLNLARVVGGVVCGSAQSLYCVQVCVISCTQSCVIIYVVFVSNCMSFSLFKLNRFVTTYST